VCHPGTDHLILHVPSSKVTSAAQLYRQRHAPDAPVYGCRKQTLSRPVNNAQEKSLRSFMLGEKAEYCNIFPFHPNGLEMFLNIVISITSFSILYFSHKDTKAPSIFIKINFLLVSWCLGGNSHFTFDICRAGYWNIRQYLFQTFGTITVESSAAIMAGLLNDSPASFERR